MKKTKTEKANKSFREQYDEAKAASPGCLLLFRVGDFYEAYGDDADKAASALGLSRTKRGDLLMTGFPYHQLEGYLAKLIASGVRVAVCDMAEK